MRERRASRQMQTEAYRDMQSQIDADRVRQSQTERYIYIYADSCRDTCRQRESQRTDKERQTETEIE